MNLTKMLGAGATVVAAVTLAGTSASAYTNGNAPTNGHINTVRAAGSDTLYFMDQQLSDLYNGTPGCALNAAKDAGGNVPNIETCTSNPAPMTENYDHDEVTQAYPTGSGNGIKGICGQAETDHGPYDFARSSRDRLSGDCQGGAIPTTFRSFAKDGIVPIVFPNTNSFVSLPPAAGCKSTDTAGNCTGLSLADPTVGLSQKNLVDIFCTGNLSDWGQIVNASDPNSFHNGTYGGTDGRKIVPFGVQPASGTLISFAKYLNGGSSCNNVDQGTGTLPQPTPAHTVFENNASQITSVANSDNGCAPSQTAPTCSAAATEESQSVYFESFGRVISSPFTTGDGAATSAVNSSGKTVPATLGNIGLSKYPITRLLYHVFIPQSYTGGSVPAVSNQGLNFLDWVCNTGSGSHVLDPETGLNYDTEIGNTVNNFGFLRIGCVDQ